MTIRPSDDNLIDTAMHAAQEAVRSLITVIDRNGDVLGLDGSDKGLVASMAFAVLAGKCQAMIDRSPKPAELRASAAQIAKITARELPR